MQNNEVNGNVQSGAAQVAVGSEHESYVIDLKHILRALLSKAWLIIIVSIITAGIGFAYSAFKITPMYSSSIMLYVNNSDVSLGGVSVSFTQAELTAAQSLAKTYMVILDNRTTLEQVIAKADVPYTWKELSGMIKSQSVNDTEIFRVSVTCTDPNEAAKIANVIATVLPPRVQEIMNGSKMVVVDSAISNPSKVSPSISKYTAIGFMLGFIVVAGIISVIAYMDDTIHDEDYIHENLGYPILAVVPDLTEARSASYAYNRYGTRHTSRTENKG